MRPERLEGVDIVVVRENVSGLYFGSWGIVSQSDNCRVAYHHSSYREDEVERILTVALALARQRRNKLDVITKPGGIPAISQLWQEKLQELNHDEGVATRVLEVDNAAYQLIAHPEDFDVVACPNLFGDVLGDCGSLLLGSRGLSFSGNFGGCGCAVYQTAHGAAWPLAGTDRANPIGQICSLGMMLRESCDLPVAAEAIEQAIELTLRAVCAWRTLRARAVVLWGPAKWDGGSANRCWKCWAAGVCDDAHRTAVGRSPA